MKYNIPLRDLRARGKGKERKKIEGEIRKRALTAKKQKRRIIKMGRRVLRRKAKKV